MVMRSSASLASFPVVNRDRSPAQARVVAHHRREHMRADPPSSGLPAAVSAVDPDFALAGIEDRDRHGSRNRSLMAASAP